MITGREFAAQAEKKEYDKIKYSQRDCQGFVEQVLYDCGVRRPDGSAYNWKGSNSMWRNALSEKGTIAEFIDRYSEIPLGSWVFMIKFDGGEKEKGYNDGEGNAPHVGIYIGGGLVRDSTRSTKTGRDGVGTRSIKDFNYVGLCKYLDYSLPSVDNEIKDKIISILTNIKKEIALLEGMVNK